MKTRNFTEFFDVYNREHLSAYEYLDKVGNWPEGFIPDDVEMDLNWHIQLMGMMADAYRNLMMLKDAEELIKWIDANERLPDAGVEVLGWDGFRPRIAWHDNLLIHPQGTVLEWYILDEGRDENWSAMATITYWMPIPKKPN